MELMVRDRSWQAIGRERAALFRHYRVVAIRMRDSAFALERGLLDYLKCERVGLAPRF